jgi:hypothetical protein
MTEESSFRDPDGFMFSHSNRLFRAVTYLYKENYDHLINSGLYDKLISDGYLIAHKEVDFDYLPVKGMYKILEPELINFISYPYEWSFSQLKDAAFLTLKIQRTALDFGMSLKDASAYNVQFHEGHPIFIDTLSFEIYSENNPWQAYKQFCQHFIAPITLMGYSDIRLNELMKNHIDGIPLDLAHKLLPFKTRFKFEILLHIHLHASAQKKYDSNSVKVSDIKRNFSKNSFYFLINSLRKTLDRVSWAPKGTEWGDYYEPGVHIMQYIEHKKQLVTEYVEFVKPTITWDLGSNTGIFSRLAANESKTVVAFDIDPACVENNYREVKTKNEQNLLPILLDVTNPSPSLGWANLERKSFSDRGPVDLVMALALIHHLAISNNLPFNKIAEHFSCLCKWLIIEFIPKDDNKVQIMLKNRTDIFENYTLDDFEKAFRERFFIEQKHSIKESKRTLYLMKKLDA